MWSILQKRIDQQNTIICFENLKNFANDSELHLNPDCSFESIDSPENSSLRLFWSEFESLNESNKVFRKKNLQTRLNIFAWRKSNANEIYSKTLDIIAKYHPLDSVICSTNESLLDNATLTETPGEDGEEITEANIVPEDMGVTGIYDDNEYSQEQEGHRGKSSDAICQTKDPMEILKYFQGKNILEKEPVICAKCGESGCLLMAETRYADKYFWKCPNKLCKTSKTLKSNSFFAKYYGVSLIELNELMILWSNNFEGRESVSKSSMIKF